MVVAKIPVNVVQKILNIGFREIELVVRADFLLRRADQETIEPREGEQDAAIIRFGDQQSVTGRKNLEWQHQVRALAQAHARADSRSGKAANHIRLRAGGVDKALRANGKPFLRKLVLYLGSLQLSIRVLCESDDARIIEGIASGFDEGVDQTDVVARVVELAVRVGDASNETVVRKAGHAFERLRLGKLAAGKEAVFPGDPFIQLHPESDISNAEPIGAGNQKFQLSGKEGSVVQHVDALVQGRFTTAYCVGSSCFTASSR